MTYEPSLIIVSLIKYHVDLYGYVR